MRRKWFGPPETVLDSIRIRAKGILRDNFSDEAFDAVVVAYTQILNEFPPEIWDLLWSEHQGKDWATTTSHNELIVEAYRRRLEE